VKLILGLGNPGLRYTKTRHNLGAEVAGEAAVKLGISLSHSTHQAEWGRGIFAGEPVVIARPLTYMNNSGEAARALTHYFKITPEQILVLSDDLNLALGQLRFRSQGSDGGHNGLKSLIEQLQTKAFNRLRIGINRPTGPMPIADFVLSRFAKEEQPVVEETINRAMQAVLCWLEFGLAKAMQVYN
jgi:peptidyl-tRNA hydrolase, PTH1 family